MGLFTGEAVGRARESVTGQTSRSLDDEGGLCPARHDETLDKALGAHAVTGGPGTRGISLDLLASGDTTTLEMRDAWF